MFTWFRRLSFLCLLLLACALVAGAQTDSLDLDSVPHYAVSHQATLSGSAAKWTLQVPANSDKRAYIVGVTLWCSVACDIIQTSNGSAATATVKAGIALNLPTTSGATFYFGSDSTGGSALDPISIPAASSTGFTSRIVLAKGQPTAQNYTFATSSITGTARIHLIWAEKSR